MKQNTTITKSTQNISTNPKVWRWSLTSVVGFFHVTPVPSAEIQTTLENSRIANAAADRSMAESDRIIEENQRLTTEIRQAVIDSAQMRH